MNKVVENTPTKKIKENTPTQERSQNLKLGGTVLLLVVCSDSSFRLSCLTANEVFFYFLGVFYVCIQVWTKLFCLKFFKGSSCLF